MLAEFRATIRDALKAQDVTAHEYLGESLTPPCAVVVPAEPYLQRPSGDGRIPFRKVRVDVDVLLLVPRGDSAKVEAAAIDGLLERAYRALNPLDTITVRRASRPGVVTISGSKFVGSVLTIEALTEEP